MPKRWMPWFATAGLVLVALEISACGGGDELRLTDEGTSASSTVTVPLLKSTPARPATPTARPDASQDIPGPARGPVWVANQRDSILEISYGTGGNLPQYAALHLDSGYFRLNYGPGSGWGTSVILVPSFWERGAYYQGAPVEASWRSEGGDFVVSLAGTVSGLRVQGELRLQPPGDRSIAALVTMRVEGGGANLDKRAGEAFKPVMLSSMRVSSALWDTQTAIADGREYPIPNSEWIIQPPVLANALGLVGGSSDWKENAPTVRLALDRPLEVTGWVTQSGDPDGDNVGYWPAATSVLQDWSYTITATP